MNEEQTQEIIQDETNENVNSQDNVQSEQVTQSTELVDYQTHVVTSLDNNNTLLICSYVFIGVLVGVLLSKTFWRKFNIWWI